VPELGHHPEVVAYRDVLAVQAVPEADDVSVPHGERAAGRRERDRLAAGRQRHFGTSFVAARLGELGALADPETAPDTIYALAAPDIYLLLVDDRGWTPDRYESWLAAQLIRGLLA
jgi:hypothetical protein